METIRRLFLTAVLSVVTVGTAARHRDVYFCLPSPSTLAAVLLPRLTVHDRRGSRIIIFPSVVTVTHANTPAGSAYRFQFLRLISLLHMPIHLSHFLPLLTWRLLSKGSMRDIHRHRVHRILRPLKKVNEDVLQEMAQCQVFITLCIYLLIRVGKYVTHSMSSVSCELPIGAESIIPI